MCGSQKDWEEEKARRRRNLLHFYCLFVRLARRNTYSGLYCVFSNNQKHEYATRLWTLMKMPSLCICRKHLEKKERFGFQQSSAFNGCRDCFQVLLVTTPSQTGHLRCLQKYAQRWKTQKCSTNKSWQKNSPKNRFSEVKKGRELVKLVSGWILRSVVDSPTRT